MTPQIPEAHKKPGVHYALTDDGVELPIIDVTHPAFALDLSKEEWRARMQDHIRVMERRAKLPGFIHRFLLKLYRRRSVLLRGIVDARGGFLSGMNTYLLKLGPENLGKAYTTRIDRRVAASFPAQAARLRLREAARNLARGVAPVLQARRGDLHLLNIAGGPAADSLNALLLLRQTHPESLVSRRIHIHVLDLHPEAPRFGKRALSALQAEGAPLHGLEIRLEHLIYDWADPSVLKSLVNEFPPDAVVAGSSEGGLFHYGSDEEIAANLEALREGTPDDFRMVGSLSWESPMTRLSRKFSGLATRAFEPPAFEALIAKAGWVWEIQAKEVSRQIVCLRKAS